MTVKNKKITMILLLVVAIIIVVPFLVLPGAEFGGSDDAGSVMVEEIKGETYEPWFTPVLENAINGEIPGEIESLLFCLQTGIGVGVIAFLMGRFYERKKWEDRQETVSYTGNMNLRSDT